MRKEESRIYFGNEKEDCCTSKLKNRRTVVRQATNESEQLDDISHHLIYLFANCSADLTVIRADCF